jgi:formate hydrogenlyase subunit 3/multisubunit Na+/H+ antiporter MnhD subunit
VTSSETFPFKKLSFFILFLSILAILGFLVFISVISIDVGITNIQQDGFWVPILAGVFVIIACLFLFIFVVRFIRNRMKEKDIINNI